MQTKSAEVMIGGSGNSTELKGSCGNSSQTLELPFGPGHSLLLTFSANETTKEFSLANIKLTVNSTALPDAKGIVSVN